MQQGKKKYPQQSRSTYAQSRAKFQGNGKAKREERQAPPQVDLSRKPVRFYLSKRGKVFPVRVLFQGETKYGDRAKVCLVNEGNPDQNSWWCDSENLFYSKREALDAMESRAVEEESAQGDGEEQEQGEQEEEDERKGEEKDEVEEKLSKLAEEAQKLGMGY
jgi:hypothetical protein